MSHRSGPRLPGVPALDLGADDYEIGVVERSRDWDDQLVRALTGDTPDTDADSESTRLLFDVVDDSGRRRLEVLKRGDPSGGGWLGTGNWRPSGFRCREFLFRTPESEARFVLHRDGIFTTYTLRATATGDTLATWSRSFGILGRWHLAAPDGTTRATVTRAGTGGFLRWFHHGSYAVRSPGGTDLARFERTETTRPGLSVSVVQSAVPPEICLGLGVTVLLEGGDATVPGRGGDR